MNKTRERRTPSFSSTLLDAIYRSTDESKSNLDHNRHLGLSLHITHNPVPVPRARERINLRRAITLEDSTDNQSSSDSSSAGIFSSSETDTFSHKKHRPKMEHHATSEKHKKENGGFARTKLRALKIYGEFNQKVKQPISPGSRIVTFLSSIFNSQNVKKAKMCYVGAVEDVTFDHKPKSPCFSSSASSFSTRSCMSKKTPKSANNAVKRSVRFYPFSVVLGEDSEQGHSYVYQSQLQQTVFKRNSSSIKELNNTRENGKGEFGFRGFYDENVEEDDDGDGDGDGDDDEDDDGVSCSSSDLFELDHIIGAARYQEELPVYETTNLETNKAIANGLCL